MDSYPPPVGTPSHSGRSASPRRDSGSPSTSPQLSVQLSWPRNLPGFMDVVNDTPWDMFSSNEPRVDRDDVPVQSTESPDETPELVDSDSELSAITSSSDASEHEDLPVDQDTVDDGPMTWLRAYSPRPAQHPFRPSDDYPPVHEAEQINEDDEYDFDTHFSLPPQPAVALRMPDGLRAGPRTAAGRAQMREFGIVWERRSRYMEARQRMARTQNARALQVLEEEVEDDGETDDEGAVALTAATMRERYPAGSQ